MHACIFRKVSCFCSLSRVKPGPWMSVDSGFHSQDIIHLLISLMRRKMPINNMYACMIDSPLVHYFIIYFNAAYTVKIT